MSSNKIIQEGLLIIQSVIYLHLIKPLLPYYFLMYLPKLGRFKKLVHGWGGLFGLLWERAKSNTQ